MAQKETADWGQMMTGVRSGRALRIARKAGVARQAVAKSRGATKASEGPLILIWSDTVKSLAKEGSESSGKAI